MDIYELIVLASQTFIVFLIGTVVNDIVHYLLHRCLKSKNPLLMAIGKRHLVHHRFFSVSLKIENKWAKDNLINQGIVEYVIHCASLLACALLFPPLPIVLAFLIATIIFAHVCYHQGADLHHRPYDSLPAHKGGIFVSAEYHALHHAHPNQFYSSYIKILDYVLGTGQQIAGKQIVMTGASGALGAHMKLLLEKQGAKVIPLKYGVDYTYDNYQNLKEPLSHADILLLCHGSKYEHAQQANCDSFIAIIELFKAVRKRGLIPLEIWGVGSEIECHPCFGFKKLKVYAQSKRNYAKKAREYFRDSNIQYRHIVHSAFTSRMGPGLMSAKVAAALTMFMLKRGFKYIPVSYTGFGYLNYLRFVFNK